MPYNHPAMPFTLHRTLLTARVKNVPAGQILMYEGDLSNDVLIIKSGIVKIYSIDEQGNEKILHLVQPPVVVPFSFFSNDSERPLQWFYATLTDCEFYTLTSAELRAMIHSDTKLADSITSTFSNDVHEILVRLSSLGKTNSYDKVTAVLKFLLAHYATKQRGHWWRVKFPINHQLIANMCGITRESTTIAIKELVDKKILRSPKASILEINQDTLLNQH